MQTEFTLQQHEKDAVISNSDLSYTDSDMDRTASDKEIDSLVGEIAELVANKFFIRHNVSISEPESYKYDILADETRIEVKGRKCWNFSNPDLLVRTKFDLSADVYLHIDLTTTDSERLLTDLSNLGTVSLIGFVTKDEVSTLGEPFNQHIPEKENDTVIIDRSNLNPIIQLFEVFSALKENEVV